MFSLTIVFGPGPMVWTLMYKNDEKARFHRDFLYGTDDQINLSDDFGQEVSLKRTEIHGSMLENMEQSKLAHIESALHKARTQAKSEEIANSDPVLAQARAAGLRRAQGGIPIMQPMLGRFPS